MSAEESDSSGSSSVLLSFSPLSRQNPNGGHEIYGTSEWPNGIPVPTHILPYGNFLNTLNLDIYFHNPSQIGSYVDDSTSLELYYHPPTGGELFKKYTSAMNDIFNTIEITSVDTLPANMGRVISGTFQCRFGNIYLRNGKFKNVPYP